MNLISKIRAERNLTQRQLAELVGITYQSLQRYENGSVIPSAVMAIRIAKVLNVTVEDLDRPTRERSRVSRRRGEKPPPLCRL